MKQLFFVLSILITLIIIACSKRTVATKDATTSPEAPSADISKTKGESANASLLAVVAAGKIIYETKCTRCHAMKPADAYTADTWDGILRSMAPKAKLTETETAQVTAYVWVKAKK
jgi:cytochrome c5